MSAFDCIQIVCDGCGAETTVTSVTSHDRARDFATEDGWSVRCESGSIDYCPDCRTPVANRHGNEVVVTQGKRVIGKEVFPLGLPTSEWHERIDALNPAGRDGNDTYAVALQVIVDFVKVEARILGGTQE
jgi:hypothetical protein